jgi:hypothetical protein
MKAWLPAIALMWLGSVTAQQRPEVQAIVSEVSPDSLLRTVRQLSGNEPVVINGNVHTILSRYWNDAGNGLTQQFLVQEFERYGWQVTSQAFGTKGLNVIASRTGALRPYTTVVLGGHFDSMPNGVAPGADDNATGIAVLLEFARICADSRFPFTVQLVAFDEEEWGLLGSTHYVQQMEATDTLLAFINLDMLGWDGNADGKCNIHSGNGEWDGVLAGVAMQALVYTDSLVPEITINSPYPSDHKPFQNEGLAAIAITEDYATDLNPNWHTANDIFSSIDSAYFVRMSQWAIATTATLLYAGVSSSSDAGPPAYMRCVPNPASQEAQLLLYVNRPGETLIQLFDATGKRMATVYDGVLEQGYCEFELPVWQLRPGTYVVQALVAGKDKRPRITARFVVSGN